MTEKSSRIIPQSIYDKVAELEGIVSEIEAAQEIKESQFPSATIGSHALTEEDLTFIEKVRQSGYRPTYNPDDKLNMEAMLPCAFARSVKMMRFINEVYDGDKERFYLAGQKSSRKNSRFISANRIGIRLNAIKAQGVYMASLEDEELSRKLLEQAERSFSRLANLIKDYGKYPVSYGMMLQKFLDKMGGSDDGLHDFTALFIYFCNSFVQQIDETDDSWRSSMIVILDKEKYNLTSFGAVEENIIEGSGLTAREMQRIFAQMLPKALPGKSFAEMWDMPPGQKEANFYQMLWDLGQLDGYSLSMFENEKFSSKELRDITNVITVRSGMMQTTKGDLTLYYIVGILLRSIFRGYKEVTDMIDEYSGIVRESEKNKKLASMAARQNNRILELEQLNMDKQEKLNESQKEIDKLRKLVAEQEEQIKHDKERIAILEQVVAEEEAYEAGYGHDGFLVREGEAGYTSDTTKARSANVIVFGGPDKWQSQVISQAPQYTCVSVDNNTFDKKNIKGADAVVFKTDYLSHKQWYAVRDYAKKCGRKIIYCRNNIPMMFEQIERALK